MGKYDTDALDSQEADIKTIYPKWEKPGDFVVGVYVDKVKNPQADPWLKMHTDYILINETGEKISVSGRHTPRGESDPGFHQILFGMKDIPFGAVIKIAFEGTQPAKQEGNQDAKMINVKFAGEFDDEVYHSYCQKWGKIPVKREEEAAPEKPAEDTGSEKKDEEEAPAEKKEEQEEVDPNKPPFPSKKKDKK